MAEISMARYRAGEGPPLVLVHGFTATWRCWLPVLAELVPHFDVLAPTLPGHDGGPEPHPPARTLGEAADHLERLLDEQGVGEAHFAGNSMGGALSLELAKRGRALSVVAISPGGGWHEDDVAEVDRIERFFLRARRLGAATASLSPRIMSRPNSRRTALRDVLVHGDRMPPREAVQLLRSSLRCTVVDEVLATVRSGSGRLTDLDRIACPTLVAWGDHDRILPMERHAPRFRGEIPGVEFRVLPGMGHTPMYDDPTRIATTIRDFALAAQATQATQATQAAPSLVA
jgi:pimeloyl-ACP methyl ester carboxylesterase